MLSTLCHQPLRGLIRSLSSVLPCSRSKVHLTSLAVNGLPSCHLTPERNLKVSSGLLLARLDRTGGRRSHRLLHEAGFATVKKAGVGFCGPEPSEHGGRNPGRRPGTA